MISRRTVLLGATGLALVGCGQDADPPAAVPTPSESSSPAVPTPPMTPTPTPTPTPTGKPNPEVAGTVVTDLDVPWGLIFFANGDALVSERNTAKLKRISPEGKVTTLGEVSGVQAPSGLGEGGLLGIAFAPGDETTLYAYLTSADDNRVVRLSLDGNKVGRPSAILAGIPTSTHHHGGRILFGPDGTLYVTTGDAETPSNAQSRSSLAGKILRITADGKAADGNPYGNRTWSYGHRNPQGLSFDADGRLWASEFGDKAADELNLIVKGGNYGWPAVEGDSDDSDYRAPKATWSPTSTSSPSGLAIARSTAFVAALQGECLFSIALDGTDAGRPKKLFGGDYGRLRTVVSAPDGSLWLTTSNTDGRQTPGRNDDRILRVTL